MNDTVTYIYGVAEKIIRHFCISKTFDERRIEDTVRGYNCIEKSLYDMFEDSTINKVDKDSEPSWAGHFIYDTILDASNHLGIYVGCFDVARVYNDIRSSIKLIYAELKLDVPLYRGGTKSIHLSLISESLIDIIDGLKDDMYIEDVLQSYVKVLSFENDNALYTVHELGGNDVVNYLYDRGCLSLMHELVSQSNTIMLHEVWDPYKTYTTYDMCKVLTQYSGKMSNLLTIGNAESVDSSEVIGKLIDKISVTLNTTKRISRLLDAYDKFGLKTGIFVDAHEVFAHTNKGESKIQAISLTYLETLKYFSGLTQAQVSECINNPKETLKYITEKEYYVWKMGRISQSISNSALSKIMQQYIKAEASGVQISQSEIDKVSEYVANNIKYLKE